MSKQKIILILRKIAITLLHIIGAIGAGLAGGVPLVMFKPPRFYTGDEVRIEQVEVREEKETASIYRLSEQEQVDERDLERYQKL